MSSGDDDTWRDAQGKTLQDYPRPSVAVDTAVLSVIRRDDESPQLLCVVLTRRLEPIDGIEWGLPGTFLHQGERLTDAVLRSLHEKASIEGLTPRQLHVFDDPERDHRGWVISVGHMDVVPENALASALKEPQKVLLVPVTEILTGDQALFLDHDMIICDAAEQLCREYARAPDPRRLLRDPFTLRQLEDLHRAIDKNTEPKDTFRRRVISGLRATGEMSSGSVGKPAKLYVHHERGVGSAESLAGQ